MAKNIERPALGCVKFYTRDSGGKAEMTPGQYVTWALEAASFD